MDSKGPPCIQGTHVIDQLDGINNGDMVKFSYVPNENGLLNITKIEKMR